jgi:putative transposase
MRHMGLRGAVRGRAFKVTTVANEGTPRPLDLVEREFYATKPNQLWVADIERHEVLTNPAVMKGHRLQLAAASWTKPRAA